MVLLAATSLVFAGCGGDDDDGGGSQGELADLLIADEVVGADEDCIRDKTAELSDEDAQFLVDNIDTDDITEFSDELVTWVNSLIDCIDLEEQNS